MLIIIIAAVTIILGFFLLRFFKIQKIRKEKKMLLEQRLDHLIQSNKNEKNESSH
jgi:hypothetical protein